MAYTQYKELENSDISWLQNKPAHWQIKRLKFSTDLINNKVSAEDSSLPYLGLEHIESWTGRKIAGEISNSEGLASSFSAGDVLFGKLRPYLAKVHLAQQDGLISSEALIVRSSDELNAEFLKYYMLSRDFINIVDSSTYGSKMPRASWDFIGNLPVLLPSIEEQQTIARFLDFKTAQIDALIAKKKALLDKLAEKRTALISHAVTKGLDPSVPMKDSGVKWLGDIPKHWKPTKLKRVTNKIIDGAHFTPTYVAEGIPFLRVTDIVQAKGKSINTDEIKFIPDHEHQDLIKRCKPEKGDLLYSKNGTIGVPRVIDWDFDFSIFVSLCLIKMNREMLLPHFLEYVLLGKLTQSQIAVGAKSNTVTNLHLDKIQEFWLVLPPVKEQESIVENLNAKTQKLDKNIDAVETAIARLQEYRSALITNAVTGKIDVRGFEIPEPAKGAAV